MGTLCFLPVVRDPLSGDEYMAPFPADAPLGLLERARLMLEATLTAWPRPVSVFALEDLIWPEADERPVTSTALLRKAAGVANERLREAAMPWRLAYDPQTRLWSLAGTRGEGR